MYRITMIAAATLLAAQPLAAQFKENTETPATEVSAETAADAPSMVPKGIMISAGAVEEATVYSLADSYDETFWDSGETFGPVATAWSEIGEVEDVVLDDTASVLGVTVDVGGFLGIGERTVLLPVRDIRLVQTPDEGFFIVTRMSRAQFEETEGIDGLIGD